MKLFHQRNRGVLELAPRFTPSPIAGTKVLINAGRVNDELESRVADEDLARFIL